MRETIVAALAGAAVAISPMTLTAQPVVSQEEVCELGDAHLCEFENASNAARDYARANPGVGILISVGTETFPLGEYETAEQFGNAFIAAFSSQGVEAGYFLYYNDSPTTNIVYYLGPTIHGQHNGTEVKGINQAVTAIPEVAEQVRIINGLPRPQ